MKELARELKAVSAFRNAAANFRAVTEDVKEGRESYSDFYDYFTSAIVSFMGSELNFRQADRANVLGIQEDLEKYSRERGKQLNLQGITLLENALISYSEFEKEQTDIFSFDETISDLIDEFDEILKNQILLFETKASDTKEIYTSFAQLYDIIHEGVSIEEFFSFNKNTIQKLIDIRRQEDRGATTNIALWKVIAIAVVACVAIIPIIRCYRLNRCSKKEKAIYDSIIVTAMLVFGACE